jgi:hypothetical protein
MDIIKGDLVTEVRQVFSEWATHVIRLIEGEGHVEVEWTAGPIPMETSWFEPVVKGQPNLWGKEVVVQYTSSIQSAGSFYTDANGREMVPRQYNARGPSYPPLVVHEPVAGNYYPVNNMIALEDSSTDVALTVLTDVSQGGSSLADGTLELMVHRRIQDDDSRGVQEPLNETMCGCGDIGADPGNMGAHGHEGDGGCLCAGADYMHVLPLNCYTLRPRVLAGGCSATLLGVDSCWFVHQHERPAGLRSRSICHMMVPFRGPAAALSSRAST